MGATPAPDLAPPRRRTGRWFAGLGAVVLVGLAGSLVTSPPAVGAAPFEGIARADGVRVSILVPGFLLVEQVSDSGLPAAQAVVDGTDSSAYAGYPYPGSGFLGAYGLGNTTQAKQTGSSLPDYPMAAISSVNGTPEDRKEYGALVLEAKSTESSSAGNARALLSGEPASTGRLQATANVDHLTSGEMQARASSAAEAVDIADVLRFGAISSSAEVKATAAGERTRTAQLRVGDVSVLGQAVGFTEQGFTFAGTNTPIPTDNPLMQALREAGVEVEYLSARRTPDGIVSAGVRVTTVQDVSLPEPVTVEYLFGRSAAFATGGSDDTGGDGGSGDTGGATDGGTVGVTTGGGTGAESPTTGGSAEPPFVPGTDGGATTGEASTGTTAAPPPETTGSGQVPVAGPGREGLVVDGGVFYLVLALAGAALVGGVQLLRLFGVKVLWTTG